MASPKPKGNTASAKQQQRLKLFRRKEGDHLVWQYEVYETRIEAGYVPKRREQCESNSKRFGWFYAYLPLFRYVASELETDIAVTVGDVKFYLHKFPLLSKSARLQNLVYRSTVDTMVWLLPAEKGSVSCSFLLKLLKAAIVFDSGNMAREQLMRRIGQQLEEASVNDLLIRAGQGEDAMYDVDTVQKIVKEFLMQDQAVGFESEEYEVQEIRRPGILTEASKLIVAKLIDAYLAEIAKDPDLPLSKFVDLAEMVSYISRPSHDRLYRAIDMYLKEHPWIGKSERKRICKLMDCKKLSADACKHAVQNERLSLRVAIQVLFFEQTRAAAASSGSTTPDLPKALKYPNTGPHESSRSSATDPEEEWDAVSASKELKALRAELAALRLSNGIGVSTKSGRDSRNDIDQAVISKMKGVMKSKRMFTKIWSSKAAPG
ncbi:hypothetical protein GQ457_04G002940 [Hibiscus cannabinus]